MFCEIVHFGGRKYELLKYFCFYGSLYVISVSVSRIFKRKTRILQMVLNIGHLFISAMVSQPELVVSVGQDDQHSYSAVFCFLYPDCQ